MSVELTMLVYATALLLVLVLVQATAGVLAQGLPAMAGARDDLPPPNVQPKPQKPKPSAKKASRTSPTDNVSDDLNRREAERAAEVMRGVTATSATPAPQAAVPAAAAVAP